jgi:hypothetical protein
VGLLGGVFRRYRPTQANSGLEWATRLLSEILDCFGQPCPDGKGQLISLELATVQTLQI